MQKEDSAEVTRKVVSEKKILRSNELFSGNREVTIEHGGAYYRLMITKAGKLILNK